MNTQGRKRKRSTEQRCMFANWVDDPPNSSSIQQTPYSDSDIEAGAVDDVPDDDDDNVNIMRFLKDDFGNLPPSLSAANRVGFYGADDEASEEDLPPAFEPVILERDVCQVPTRQMRQMARGTETNMRDVIPSINMTTTRNHEEEEEGDYIITDNDYSKLMGAVDDDDDDDDREEEQPWISTVAGQESCVYDTDLPGNQFESPPPNRTIINLQPDLQNNNNNDPNETSCISCNSNGAVWCFGCKWGSEGYRPVDNEKISRLVSHFRDNLLSGMSTIANVAVDTAELYEETIRQPSIEEGHPLPRWPAWVVEKHIRNIREPQIRLALNLESVVALLEKISQHVVKRDPVTGSEQLYHQAGRLYLATVKEWRELSRMDPSHCFGSNVSFRPDPSRYATLVDASRIAASGAAGGDLSRPGQPSCAGAPVASLPGQRGARGPSYSRSGVDTGELRLQGNGEELLRRVMSGPNRGMT